MIRKLITTAASRFAIAFINLAIVWLSARTLGAAGMGTISLFILGISINQLISALPGGSVLVYQVPRKPLFQLLLPAWIWALLVSAAGSFLLGFFNLVPHEYVLALAGISLIQSTFSIHQNVLLGREKVKLYNILTVAQSATMLASVAILFLFFSWRSVEAYITALYISFGLVLVAGSVPVLKRLRFTGFPLINTITETFRFGGYLQAASVMQLFNYRLSYYIIEKYFDRATLGVFSIGVQIAESVWIVSKSIAMVQYARIANARNHNYARDLTQVFIQITTVLTIGMLIVLLLLPPEFFILVFRSDFGNIHSVIYSLSGGILAVAVSLMLSHYFSGSGRPWHNTISSGIGLAFTLILGFTLIPKIGIKGAGITATASYAAGTLYQLGVFTRVSKARFLYFIPFTRPMHYIISLLQQDGSSTDGQNSD